MPEGGPTTPCPGQPSAVDVARYSVLAAFHEEDDQVVAGFWVDFIRIRLKWPMMQEVADAARCAVRDDGAMHEVIRMASASVIAARSAGDATQDLGVIPVSAVVPKIDQRIGERLERVMHVTDAFKAQQQSAKLENHLAAPPPSSWRRRG